MTKWKDEYRCAAPYNETTGEFPRDDEGNLSEEDVYIVCAGQDMIYDYDSGKSILIAHFDRGRKVASEIYKKLYQDFEKKFIKTEKPKKEGEESKEYTDWEKFYKYVNSLNLDIINHIQENDQELWFHFNGNKHIEEIAMKAKKPKANKSPFNSQYLPSHKEKLKAKKLEEARYVKYEMPKGYWDEMKTMLPSIAKKDGVKIDKVLERLYKSFGKKKKINFIAESDKNNYKINHYIHHLGFWDEFVNFVKGCFI